MPTNTFLGRLIEVDKEGFLTVPDQWDEDLADRPRTESRGGRTDGRTLACDQVCTRGRPQTGPVPPPLRRMQQVGGFDIKTLFTLFPGKPAKKLVYIGGRSKPTACV